MKAIWTIVALLLLGGLAVLLQPPSTGVRGELRDLPDVPPTRLPEAAARPEPAPEPEPEPEPFPAPAPERARAGAGETGTDVAPDLAGAAETLGAPAAEASPATEPAAADRPAAESAEVAGPVVDGAEFRPEVPSIKEAELLPSRFMRLPDGAISIDDAWTVRGEGTSEKPYEVSWEFLSSAQDDYVPRLGERKIPERIAFLSGKRVRISGYLAFPLVAPTSSECLVMLNQWDGCCIGIPPTPYDAIEVKLATALKGWKRHTVNFGAVEGVFKVEPYLVENWLVGLYLLEGAKISTEL